MGRTARNYPKGKLKLSTPKVVQSDKRDSIYIEYNWNADPMTCYKRRFLLLNLHSRVGSAVYVI